MKAIVIVFAILLVGLLGTLFAFPRLGSPALSANEIQLGRLQPEANSAWSPISRFVHGSTMQLVPAGCFVMGTSAEQLEVAQDSCDSYYGIYGCSEDFSHEMPAHEVCISQPFWIDRLAVRNWEYQLIRRETPPSQYEDFSLPVQGIDWQAAADFCQLRGGRLPTEAEWEFAARGPDALIFAYGNEYDIHLSTLRKISPPEGGQIANGASWVGAMDMSGGQSEWVSDWYGPYSGEDQRDPSGPATGEQRIARGGNWFAHAAYFVRSTFREPLPADYATAVSGVRCVIEAQ